MGQGSSKLSSSARKATLTAVECQSRASQWNLEVFIEDIRL